MVFIHYHRKKVELDKEGRIKDSEKKRLESGLRELGWTNLRWAPRHIHPERGIKWKLYGCPPNYEGPCDPNFYEECAIKTLVIHSKPWKDSGEILIRAKLNQPLFDGNDSWD